MIDEKILSQFKDLNVLVTGGTGMIGRAICQILHQAGARVTSVSMEGAGDWRYGQHLIQDLTYFQGAKLATQGQDVVFATAGIKGSIEVTKSHPASFMVPMLQFNTNTLEACRVNEVGTVVYTSSIGAYGNAGQEIFVEGEHEDADPMDFFPGWAKRVAEKQIQAYKIQYGLTNYSVLRPCNIFGPYDNFDPNNAMVIPSLMAKVLKFQKTGEPVVVWGDGSAIRDFLYSYDAAEACIRAAFHPVDYNYLNVGSGRETSIKELVETLQTIVPFEYSFDTTKSNGFPRRVMSPTLCEEKIGFRASTSLKNGLQQTWEWLLENQEHWMSRHNYFTKEA